jgi:hypothetical protein
MGLLKSRASSEAPSSEVAVRTPPARRGALRSVLPRRIGPVGASSLATVTSWPALSTSRGAALSIPAVKQCRDLIVGAAVQMAVYRHRAGRADPEREAPHQPDPDTTWARTLAGTIEDMIYDGIGYWLVLARDGQSSERNPDGLPVRARWIPSCDVTPKLSPDAGSYSRLEGYQIAGIEGIVATENVVRFESPLPAVLVVGADAIENALASGGRGAPVLRGHDPGRDAHERGRRALRGPRPRPWSIGSSSSGASTAWRSSRDSRMRASS